MWQLLLTGLPMLAVAGWEQLRPARTIRYPVLRRRLSNIGLWLASATIAEQLFTEPDQLRAPWALPWWLSLLIGFIVIDLSVYWVHRANHMTHFLWRFHALHHTDPDPDWSTAVRHHPGEYLIMAAIYWTAIMAVGVPAFAVGAHAGAEYVVSVACHGNVRWPLWLERLLSPVLITLDLHLIHHSIDPAQANANFGAVFSVWDRLFGTFTPGTRDPLTFGVREIAPRDACLPSRMLLTPFLV